jgi:hypothetical protein
MNNPSKLGLLQKRAPNTNLVSQRGPQPRTNIQSPTHSQAQTNTHGLLQRSGHTGNQPPNLVDDTSASMHQGNQARAGFNLPPQVTENA